MNLPILIEQLYGQFQFTGLYSFEFRNRNKKITEIFFFMPPKSKDVSEGTRSTTHATLSANYNTDAGNATKTITLRGDIHFPLVGSPQNPLAASAAGLSGQIDGLSEFFKLRWMLIRYRDYTMTKNGKLEVPTIAMTSSPEIVALYKKVSRLLSSKVGALMDEVELVFHDYDMDDHFYVRVVNFSSSQTDTKYLASQYTIQLEAYRKYNAQTAVQPKVKRTINEEIDLSNNQIQTTKFPGLYASIQLPGGAV